MPNEYKQFCDEQGIPYIEHKELNDNINEADILYMTRVQRERFTDLMEYEKVKNVYTLKSKMLENTRDNMRILHPLPRVTEIDYDVDDSEKAYYFDQAQNGLYVRQAVISHSLGLL
jgi:aspartate carbamoyltransferase catalytic subunit